METNSALQDALRELAEARRQHEKATWYALAHQERVDAQTWYRDLIEAKKQVAVLGNAIGDAESRVRELALDYFYVTENSRPAEGVQVKLFNKVEYQRDEAEKWCFAHAAKYMALDTKAFEKAAPVLRDLGAPVELTHEPRVSIGTDLSAWLTSAGDPS